MSQLSDLIVDCGKSNPPGTETDLYYFCSCEINSFPRTKKELATDPATVQPGDSVVLGEAFDFSSAPTGEGYWRKARILLDTGEIKDVLEGEVGGQGFKSSFNFFVIGTDAEQLEFANDMAAASGFMILMLADLKKNRRVIGKDSRPAYVESLEIGTGAKVGDRRGGAYTCSASTGGVAPIYDSSLEIKRDPNV